MFPNELHKKQQAFTFEGQTNVIGEGITKQPPNGQEVITIKKQSTSKVDVIQLSDDEPENNVGTTGQPVQDFGK